MRALSMLLRWRVTAALILLFGCGFALPAQAMECEDLWQWLHFGCRKVVDTYDKGNNGLLLSGYAWHLPSTWTPEARAAENSNAWGAGWARTVEQPNGDTDTVYFMVFSDSHEDAQFNLGYAWATYWGPREYPQPGLGFTAAIIQRPDIASGVPVPVILPMFNLRYDQFTLMSTFIPTLNGGINHGSVWYFFGEIVFK
jgi:lipid IVA palmitoyltransferase